MMDNVAKSFPPCVFCGHQDYRIEEIEDPNNVKYVCKICGAEGLAVRFVVPRYG